MKHARRTVFVLAWLSTSVVLGAACIVPERDMYPDGVPKSSFVATGGNGGAGGAAPVCGDGVVDASTSETCDDGNVTTGDGCDGVCQAEPCFTCPASGGACSLSAAGTDCSTGGQVCNGQGVCVACLPIGTTCTGTNCRFCDGATCTSKVGDCASGECVDGFCCNVACGDACAACDFPGLEGTCLAPVPDGWQETGCKGTNACQAGVCDPLPMNKMPVGGFCSNDQACVNGTCVAGVCRLKTGDPCSESAQCETNFCGADQICGACVMGTDCPSGTCSSGVCLAGVAEPCTNAADCIMGLSCNGICKLSPPAACQFDYECVTNLCFMGACSNCDEIMQKCANAGVCDPGQNCPFAVLPAGALCKNNGTCASGICGGIPPRCE